MHLLFLFFFTKILQINKVKLKGGKSILGQMGVHCLTPEHFSTLQRLETETPNQRATSLLTRPNLFRFVSIILVH